jgi:hypothetical protein
MSSSTYGGLVREIPIIPFPATILNLVRGQVVQWMDGVIVPWVSGSNTPFGVATSDADVDLLQIDVYCGKGASVQILCAAGIVPAPGDLLYFSATLGSVTNVASGAAVAKAIGTGENGYVEAVLI